MTDKQPEALRLALRLEAWDIHECAWQAAAELRRLHEVNAQLVDALELCSKTSYIRDAHSIAIEALAHSNPVEFDGIKCDRCGKVNPAEIHTCTPIEPLLEMLRVPENKREWVGLEDDDMNKLRHLVDWTVPLDIKKFARAIEAKLKEKNTL